IDQTKKEENWRELYDRAKKEGEALKQQLSITKVMSGEESSAIHLLKQKLQTVLHEKSKIEDKRNEELEVFVCLFVGMEMCEFGIATKMKLLEATIERLNKDGQEKQEQMREVEKERDSVKMELCQVKAKAEHEIKSLQTEVDQLKLQLSQYDSQSNHFVPDFSQVTSDQSNIFCSAVPSQSEMSHGDSANETVTKKYLAIYEQLKPVDMFIQDVMEQSFRPDFYDFFKLNSDSTFSLNENISGNAQQIRKQQWAKCLATLRNVEEQLKQNNQTFPSQTLCNQLIFQKIIYLKFIWQLNQACLRFVF
ncbi:viral A-type inclusion protein, partial [Reticulomyxa filosa]